MGRLDVALCASRPSRASWLQPAAQRIPPPPSLLTLAQRQHRLDGLPRLAISVDHPIIQRHTRIHLAAALHLHRSIQLALQLLQAPGRSEEAEGEQ